MKRMAVHKYRPYPLVDLAGRTWPSRRIEAAPIWCSVDLRDGNQALVNPMTVEEKLAFYGLLVRMGFGEIEVGFPSASQTEYDFVRLLIAEDHIPDNVAIQVLTQAREHLIRRTFEAIEGARRVILHLYNSTSELQRRVVFRKDRQEIIDLAVAGTRMMREVRAQSDAAVTFEYSPESFTGTELDFAKEICEAVVEAWQPSMHHKMIINLPATVEMSTPNVYADQIEWFSTHVANRDFFTLSIHPHNDRGTAVAAAELALMAGAERVEGTLFGNGERTGNVDLVTLALNMASQGVDPGLDFSDINDITEMTTRCTKIPAHIRHPYAGELVYTAFSGSHQDAINKGLKAYEETSRGLWEVPYLPIDPSDVGRTYESIIRINSQSGKGGVAYVMEMEYGMVLPKGMHSEFGGIIQALSDAQGTEIQPRTIWEVFAREYLDAEGPLQLKKWGIAAPEGCGSPGKVAVEAVLARMGVDVAVRGEGNGPVDAFTHALQGVGLNFRLVNYAEHALSAGSDSKAAAYVEIETGSGQLWWGAGVDENIDLASFKAILSGLNRAVRSPEK
jgi:2-isopropylmalate synthase